jgi:hypothetical protein
MNRLCEKYIKTKKLIKELIPDWDRIPAEIRQVRLYAIMHHKCPDCPEGGGI